MADMTKRAFGQHAQYIRLIAVPSHVLNQFTLLLALCLSLLFTATSSCRTTPAHDPNTNAHRNSSRQIWIAVRNDGHRGKGTQTDPYDGSTPEKFDALMEKFSARSNLEIHLVGAGPFRTYANHDWKVQSGWTISGDGMDKTVVKMVGNVSGIHYGVSCFMSDSGFPTDKVTIRDLTIDCNWAELSRTADTGKGGRRTSRPAPSRCGGAITWSNTCAP